MTRGDRLSRIFRRVMFWLLVPACVLLAESLSALLFFADSRTVPFDFVTAAFGYVLLGSMVLNSWLALRHPDSFSQRALPLALSIVHLGLYLVEAVGLYILFQTIDNPGSSAGQLLVPLTVPLMGLSIASLVLILRRKRPTTMDCVAAAPLTPPVTIGLIAVVTLAASTVASYLAWRTDATEGFWTFAVMAPGLPWSHVVYFVMVAPVSTVGGGHTLTLLLLVPAAVNAVLAVALLVSAPLRTRAANWFFRLNGEGPATEVTGPSR